MASNDGLGMAASGSSWHPAAWQAGSCSATATLSSAHAPAASMVAAALPCAEHSNCCRRRTLQAGAESQVHGLRPCLQRLLQGV